VCVAVCLPLAHSTRWGRAGHAIQAAVAQHMLNAHANDEVRYLLQADGGLMADIASWADGVKNMYPWSSALHYADVPDWLCAYNHARDCGNEVCVDGAIQNYTARLHTVPDYAQQNEALKFLVHFVGDTHQPLHAGFLSDLGGNSITGTFMGRSTNLHSLWDTGLVQKRIDDDFGSDEDKFISYLYSEISGPWAAQAKQWAACSTKPYAACSDIWAAETALDACTYSYVDADGQTRLTRGFVLGDAYYRRNIPIVELQLAKSSVRLATVLNAVFNAAKPTAVVA